MNNQVICEDPVIIRNPRLKQLLYVNKSYHTPFQDVTYDDSDLVGLLSNFQPARFSPKRMKVTKDNINEYYVYNCDTGVFFPMFIQVPCGKCTLCKDKRTRDWQFRSLCESITSKSPTYFVTLTYNPKYYPSRGVHIEAIQLFMKRLRISLDRLKIEHNIKYFAVGEYGKQSKRPHYHLLLWNFPVHEKFPNVSSILHFIEKCWSVYKRDENWNWIYNPGEKTPVREPLGFCYCVPCDKGAYGYVMKYMRKDLKAPEGKNPTFYTMSKRIASDYVELYRKFYESHPEYLEISAFDSLLGQQVTVSLPAYFVNKYIPRASELIPKSVRDAFDKYLELLNTRYALCIPVLNYNHTDIRDNYPYLTPSELEILDFYFPLIHNCEFGKLCPPATKYNMYLRYNEEEFCDEYYRLTIELDTLECVLRCCAKEIDTKRCFATVKRREKRMQSLENWYGKQLPVNIEELAWKKREKLNKSISKEIL